MPLDIPEIVEYLLPKAYPAGMRGGTLGHKYWLAVYTEDTWNEFIAHGADVAGFPLRRRKSVRTMKRGDHLVFYVMGLKRLVGIAEITGGPYESDEQIWASGDYPLRVGVDLSVQAPRPEQGVPITELLGELDLFERRGDLGSWGVRLRGTPKVLSDSDGQAILAALHKALSGSASTLHTEAQYLLLQLGANLGLDVYVAVNDRSRLYGDMPLGSMPRVVDSLPQSLPGKAADVIKYVDVLWFEDDAVVAAFEVECTTDISRGWGRMADLLACQPNLSIPHFIVAPEERREKVRREVNRPALRRLGSMGLKKEYVRYVPIEGMRIEVLRLGSNLRGAGRAWILDRISEEVVTRL
ncbi:EVE domain-containing protein [Streptosporangium sp. NPDC001559]|uniref:EVE domain-containing protein n=1 Tax=Streptosporangium sp. NPDC001559 TaxID=3366187 RepID=UPI0036E3D81B